LYIRICFCLSDVYTDIFKLGRDLEGNPDINEIVKAMEQEYDKMKEQSRFLIFVKTRATAKALAERLPKCLCIHLINGNKFLYTNTKQIKVSFCPQKRMSPPVPQTVVKGKKSI
jgi:Lhr-like helicase